MKPTNERALVRIYRSSAKQEMYLYVSKQGGLEQLPPSLLEHFGRPILVMDLLLTRERKLARVDTGKVLDQLVEKGFYLQMPPAREDLAVDQRRQASTVSKPGV